MWDAEAGQDTEGGSGAAPDVGVGDRVVISVLCSLAFFFWVFSR